jgi:hypothetical protein
VFHINDNILKTLYKKDIISFINPVCSLLQEMVDENLGIQKERPLGIKLVAYFHYLLIVIAVITGIISLITANYSSGLGSLGGDFQGLLKNLGIFSVLLSVLFTSLICFFIGRGIWKGDKSSRIIVIILACIVFISQLFTVISSVSYLGNGYSIGSLLMSLFYLIAAISIFCYLVFNKNGKDWFKR